jgi:TRAP-type transport system periplasmic protein
VQAAPLEAFPAETKQAARKRVLRPETVVPYFGPQADCDSDEMIEAAAPDEELRKSRGEIDMNGVTRKLLLRGCLSGAAMLAAPGVLRTGAWGAQPRTMRLASIDTPDSPNQVICDKFAELVEAKTNGAIKLQTFAVGQLGTLQNIMSGLRTGIVDFTTMTTGFIDNLSPHVQLLDLPFLFRDSAMAEALLDGPIGQQFFNDMRTKGIIGLAWGHYGWRIVETTDRIVRGPDDMKNLKIRVQPGAIFAATFKALGAIPVVLDVTELYIGLTQRTVGGFELPFVAYQATKLYEVSKHAAVTDHVYNAMGLLASRDKFESLDRLEQAAIREAAAELQPFWRKLIAERTNEARAAMQAKGITIDAPDHDAFRAAVAPVYADFRSTIGGPLLDLALKMNN